MTLEIVFAFERPPFMTTRYIYVERKSERKKFGDRKVYTYIWHDFDKKIKYISYNNYFLYIMFDCSCYGLSYYSWIIIDNRFFFL